MPVRSPHEAKRNAGFTRTGDEDPDCAALHPGYACYACYIVVPTKGFAGMPGFGPIGGAPIGGVPDELAPRLMKSTGKVALSFSALIIPDNSLVITEKKVVEGRLISSTSAIWEEVVRRLASDWSVAQQLTPQQWEELVAGAFKNAGYDEVILTSRSSDHGRDIVATSYGVGCVKVLGSVKAYKPGNLVPYSDVRELIGVLSGDHAASKGIIATTSDFPPRLMDDPFIAPLVPTRLELMNGHGLQRWLRGLTGSSGE
jgi:restriction system protein